MSDNASTYEWERLFGRRRRPPRRSWNRKVTGLNLGSRANPLKASTRASTGCRKPPKTGRAGKRVHASGPSPLVIGCPYLKVIVPDQFPRLPRSSVPLIVKTLEPGERHQDRPVWNVPFPSIRPGTPSTGTFHVHESTLRVARLMPMPSISAPINVK